MLTMEMVLHKDVDFAPKFGKNLFNLIYLFIRYWKLGLKFRSYIKTRTLFGSFTRFNRRAFATSPDWRM